MCRCCGFDPLEMETVEAVAALAYNTVSFYMVGTIPHVHSFAHPGEHTISVFSELVVMVLENPDTTPWELFERAQALDLAAGLDAVSEPYFLLSREHQAAYRLIRSVIKAALSGMRS